MMAQMSGDISIMPKQEFTLKKKLSNQKQNQTLTHEILHAMFHEAGLDKIANDEKIILPLGYVLYQFEKENKIK